MDFQTASGELTSPDCYQLLHQVPVSLQSITYETTGMASGSMGSKKELHLFSNLVLGLYDKEQPMIDYIVDLM
jgi:hypothetical protein